jgi:shikimate kinase
MWEPIGTPRNNAPRRKSSLIVEIVGPAGAGKTTLSRILRRRNEKILEAADIELRKVGHLPIFAGHAPLMLPVFLRRCRPSRWFTWDEIKAIVYLKAWPRVLRRQASNNDTVILLDQGPVFRLATLHAFGPDRLKSPGFDRWWDSMFKQWAFTLDVVIWLDAPATVLVERINARDKRHAVRGKSELEAHQFLARYRMSYEQVLAQLRAYRELTLLQFDTDHAPVEQIADEVLAAVI